MKPLKRIYFVIISLIVVGTCNTPVEPKPEFPDLYYSSLSVCDCYKSGMSVLSNLVEYKEDMYRTLFQELRMNCLTKYGSQLFIPTNCNYPDSMQTLIDSLYSMGIDING